MGGLWEAQNINNSLSIPEKLQSENGSHRSHDNKNLNIYVFRIFKKKYAHRYCHGSS